MSPRPQGRRSNAPERIFSGHGFPAGHDTRLAGSSYGTTNRRRSSSAGSRPSAFQTVVRAGRQFIRDAERTFLIRSPAISAAGRKPALDSSGGRRTSSFPWSGPSPRDQPGNRFGYDRKRDANHLLAREKRDPVDVPVSPEDVSHIRWYREPRRPVDWAGDRTSPNGQLRPGWERDLDHISLLVDVMTCISIPGQCGRAHHRRPGFPRRPRPPRTR